MIADLTRNFGPERAEGIARLAVGLRDLGVIAIGLGGDEANWPPALYQRAYAIAREGGLHGVVHAGEAAGPESVRAAVELLGAERIGHGVRAVEDPAVVALLAERGIPLEICPTSNRLTGAAPAGRPHPVGALDAAGCVVTLDADDPALFGTTLLDEYRLVESWLGPEAVLRFARNGIEASFAARAHQGKATGSPGGIRETRRPNANGVADGRPHPLRRVDRGVPRGGLPPGARGPRGQHVRAWPPTSASRRPPSPACSRSWAPTAT